MGVPRECYRSSKTARSGSVADFGAGEGANQDGAQIGPRGVVGREALPPRRDPAAPVLAIEILQGAAPASQPDGRA
jgi:hypothetical protein